MSGILCKAKGVSALQTGFLFYWENDTHKFNQFIMARGRRTTNVTVCTNREEKLGSLVVLRPEHFTATPAAQVAA